MQNSAAPSPHAAGKHWPRAVRDNARLAFLAGNVTLPMLALKTGVPHDTLKRWSRAEGWTRRAAHLADASDTEATRRLADFLASERVEHIQSAIARGHRLQSVTDAVIETVETARDLRDVVSAEDRVDVMLRRNLGFDTCADAGSPRIGTVNVLSLGVLALA